MWVIHVLLKGLWLWCRKEVWSFAVSQLLQAGLRGALRREASHSSTEEAVAELPGMAGTEACRLISTRGNQRGFSGVEKQT